MYLFIVNLKFNAGNKFQCTTVHFRILFVLNTKIIDNYDNY